MKIVIIMPTYNERENIERMVDVLINEEFPKITKHDMHLLIVDGNSPDGTGEYVKRVEKKYANLHLLLEPKKQGLGMAYIQGMQYAMDKMKADAVFEMDADFQHNPADVKRLVEALDSGADVAIGSRYVKGGGIPKEWEIHRKFLSYFGNVFARLVLFLPQLHDFTTGFRAVRTKWLKKIDLNSLLAKESYAYKIDLTVRLVRLQAKIVEVPIIFLPRTKEKSKFSKKETLKTFVVVIKLKWASIKRLIKFGIVGFIGYIINAGGLELFFRLGLSVGIAAAIGAELAIISNFTWHNIWTFKGSTIKGERIYKKFFQFNLTSIGAIALQAIVVHIGTSLWGVHLRQLFLIIAVLFFVVPYNYTMYNVFIWKRWKLPVSLIRDIQEKSR